MTDDERENQIKMTAYEMGAGYDEHAKQLTAIADRFRPRFQQDYRGTTASLGAVLVVGSLGLAAFGRMEGLAAFGVCALGVTLVLAAPLFRARIERASRQHAYVEAELERDRHAASQRAGVLRQVGTYGLPSGSDLPALISLLGIGQPSSSRPTGSDGNDERRPLGASSPPLGLPIPGESPPQQE